MNNKHELDLFNEEGRGGRIYNQTASRVMKSFLITDLELKGLTQFGRGRTVAFSVGGFFLSQSINLSEMTWTFNMSTVIAVASFGLGLVLLWNSREIVSEVRSGGKRRPKRRPMWRLRRLVSWVRQAKSIIFRQESKTP